MNKTSMFLSALVLGGFAVAGVTLVATTHAVVDQRITDNHRLAMQRKLDVIVPGGRGDNDPLSDRIEVSDQERLGAEVTQIYRVREGNQPVALVLNPVVPDGYAGPIKLLVSVLPDGRVGGVRVLSHHETPGLGDWIDDAKSDWVLGFNGKSLGAPAAERWRVKRDGGDFDQFTGATITPRAVVKAVKNTLEYVQVQGERLYTAPPIGPKGKEAS
jgi:electron transport complex protein RnfG